MKLAQKLVIGYYRAKLNIFSKLSKRKAAEKAFELFCTPYPGKKTKTPAVFEKAEKLHLKVGNYKLVGYRWNHPQPKKVLIIHGFSSTVKKFDHFVMPLVKKGYEVIGFDGPAHGESSGKTVNAFLYKDMLNAVYEKFGPIHSFIAHSFGGLSLSLFMEEQQYQDHKKMVLIAPATETESALKSFAEFLKLDDEVTEEMRTIIYEQSGRNIRNISVRECAKKISAEVLWVHDIEDDITPWADAEKIQRDAHPNFRFITTKGLGHRRIYRDSKVRKAIIEFL